MSTPMQWIFPPKPKIVNTPLHPHKPDVVISPLTPKIDPLDVPVVEKKRGRPPFPIPDDDPASV